jgi:hypothetical protein
VIYYGIAGDRIKVGYSWDASARCRTHASQRIGWETLGWHAGTQSTERAWHRYARKRHEPVGIFTQDTEWYLRTDELLHEIHFRLIHQHARAHVAESFWDLWIPLHDLPVRGQRRCRLPDCRERVA